MGARSFWIELRGKIIFGLFTILLFAAALGGEFRYNYVENAIGRYLAWHNSGRQASGQIWESVSVSEDVQKQLDDLVRTRRQETAVETPVGSLDELIQEVFFREKLVITRDQFIEMYLRFPLYHSAMIIDPVEMLEMISALTNWQRTLVVFEQGDLYFYLVDGLNNVLEERSLSSEYINYFLAEKESRSFGLDAFSSFSGAHYPADIFYDAWALLAPGQRSGIPLSNEELIAWRYRLQQLGVNHRTLIGDRMELGFELSGDEGLTTVRILGRSLAVLALVEKMDILLSGRTDDR
jgi:hypothetical protein